MSAEANKSETSLKSIPLFPQFTTRILPLLAIYWIVGSVSAVLFKTGIPLVLAGWLTPTTIMLWPVGRRYGLAYKDYRTPWFIASVVSMAGVPITVFWIITTPFSDVIAKYAALFLLIVLVIGFFGVEASSRRTYGKPLNMFFRPDLIMGSNRMLAGGLAAMAIGMKFIFSNGPPGDTPIGNWYAFFFIIVLGLYQIIPLRGLLKMKTMVNRMIYGRGGSYVTTLLKEVYFVVAISLMLFGAHNFFGGVTPFSKNVLAGSIPGLVIMIISGTLCVVIRSLYKRHIGDPFIRERFGQSILKDLILVIFMTFYFYGFINVMVGHFPRIPNVGDSTYLTLIGITLYLWGVALLVPLRAWGRRNAKFGIMEQMMTVVLPALKREERKRVMGKIVDGITSLPEKSMEKIVRFHLSTLLKMPPEERAALMETQMEVLSELPPEKRTRMMIAMDAASRM